MSKYMSSRCHKFSPSVSNTTKQSLWKWPTLEQFCCSLYVFSNFKIILYMLRNHAKHFFFYCNWIAYPWLIPPCCPWSGICPLCPALYLHYLNGPFGEIRDPPLYRNDKNYNHSSSMKEWFGTQSISNLDTLRHLKYSHMIGHFETHLLITFHHTSTPWRSTSIKSGQYRFYLSWNTTPG